MLLPGSIFAQNTPLPANFITKTPLYHPPLIKGILIDYKNPFNMDFIIDVGDIENQKDLPSDIETLIKYFLTALTIPEDQMWVNLSPDENEAIIPDSFGQTSMGRDLLMQDYFLKQLTASLVHPDTATGKKFWEKVYRRAYQEYGTTDLPFETFNKVWISPESANVFVNLNKAYIIDAHLKVEHETMKGESKVLSLDSNTPEYSLPKEVMQTVILPILEEEINSGETFSQLRQIYHSVILSAWFKRQLKDHILSQTYVDHEDLPGLTFASFQGSSLSHEIWESYIETFKEGVYDFIREEAEIFSNPTSSELIPRQYFSGGVTTTAKDLDKALHFHSDASAISKPEKPHLRVHASLESPQVNDPIQPTVNNVRDFLHHLQKDFFSESKKQGLLPKRQSSRILDVRCILASHILAQVLSHQFNMPIGGESPYRIDIVRGRYLPDMSTHFWLALYMGDNQSPLFIDGSYGQFNHLWDQTIAVGSQYEDTLVRRKLKDVSHSSSIEKQFLPEGSFEKAEKVSNSLLKKFNIVPKNDSDASQIIEENLPSPIDLFMNAVGFLKYPYTKEELLKKLQYRDEEDFLTDIGISMRNIIMNSIAMHLDPNQDPHEARQNQGLKSIQKTLKDRPAALDRIAIIADMYRFTSFANHNSPEGDMARLFLEKLGEFDAKYFFQNAPQRLGVNVFNSPFPIAPPQRGIPKLDDLPVLDLGSGPRGAFLMKNAYSFPLIFVDNHPFIESFLKNMAKLFHLEKRIEVLNVDISKDWKKIFQNRLFKHIRLANVEAYAGELKEEFYHDLSFSMPEGATLSLEFPGTEISRQHQTHSFEKYVEKFKGWELIEKKTLKGLIDEPIEAWVYQRKPLTHILPDNQVYDPVFNKIRNQVVKKIQFGNPYGLHNLPSHVISSFSQFFGSLRIEFFLKKDNKPPVHLHLTYGLLALFVAPYENIEISARGDLPIEVLEEGLNLIDDIIQDWQMQEEGINNNPKYEAYKNKIIAFEKRVLEQEKLKEENLQEKNLGGITLKMDSVLESHGLPENKPIMQESLIHLPLKGLVPNILSIQVIGDVKALLI